MLTNFLPPIALPPSLNEKGTYFERLSAAFLLADPVQAEQYEAVWTWAEWVAGPGAPYAGANGWSGKDVGIDLVAKLRGHEGYAAIQCKFYDPQHRIAQADLAGFLTVSAKDPFHHRVVMDSTVVEWSSNADAMLLGLDRPVIRIGLSELRASPIQWGQFAAKGEVVLAPKKELRPHQLDALAAVRAGFADHARGKVIMACGTGKTFTSLKIAEDLVGADGVVLFLVPSLALMAQTVRDGITDAGLKYFQAAYPEETITKEDVFYYVYGLLHSDDYRSLFGESLYKQLPRIPTVKTAADFWAFTAAGRKLGDLHVGYGTVEPYPVVVAQGDLRLASIANPEAFFHVTKMRFGGKGKDRSTIIYNSNITITDIPEEAYEYVVNGKPAIEWVMERQAVKEDPTSGITNDANRYAVETMGDPRYPFDLLCRVITVSLETVKIVRGLPKLNI